MSRRAKAARIAIAGVALVLVLVLPAAALAALPAQSATETPTATATATQSQTPMTASATATAAPTQSPTLTASATPTTVPTVGPPTLVSPADGATLYETNPTFQWNAVPGAAFYTVQVATAPDFGSVTHTGTATTTQYTTTAPIAAGLYYWRVGAWDGVQMVWSSSRSLTLYTPTPSNTPTVTLTPTPNLTATAVAGTATANAGMTATANALTATASAPTATAFPAPTLILPADGAALANPQLGWSAVSGSAWYKVEVARDSGFTDFAVNTWVAAPQTTYAPSAGAGPYFWRVASWDGEAAHYSEARALTVIAGPSPTPTATATTTSTATATATPSHTATGAALTPLPPATQAASPTPNVCDDLFESDNDEGSARQIVIGEAQQRTFCLSAGGRDTDWARVTLKPGVWWRISASTEAGTLDPALTVYRNGEALITADDEDGKNAAALVLASTQGDYQIKVENLGLDGTPSVYTLAVQKVTMTAGADGGGAAPTAREAQPARRPVRLIVNVFVDQNADNTLDAGAGEGVNQVGVRVSANGGAWEETAFVQNGTAVFVLPASVPDDAEVRVEIPYLHRSARFRIPQGGGDIQSDVALAAPVYPVFLP